MLLTKREVREFADEIIRGSTGQFVLAQNAAAVAIEIDRKGHGLDVRFMPTSILIDAVKA